MSINVKINKNLAESSGLYQEQFLETYFSKGKINHVSYYDTTSLCSNTKHKDTNRDSLLMDEKRSLSESCLTSIFFKKIKPTNMPHQRFKDSEYDAQVISFKSFEEMKTSFQIESTKNPDDQIKRKKMPDQLSKSFEEILCNILEGNS